MKVIKTTVKGRRKPTLVLAMRVVRFDVYQKSVLWVPGVVVFSELWKV